MVGDAVNVAARGEAATRTTGDPILIWQWTRALLSEDAAGSLQMRGNAQLKGKSDSVAPFAPRALVGETAPTQHRWPQASPS